MGIMDLFLEIVGALALVVVVAVLGDRFGASKYLAEIANKPQAPPKAA